MTELRTRQEELWWDAPRIRYMRNRVIESVNRSADWLEEGKYPHHNHVLYASFKTISPIRECIQVLTLEKDGWWSCDIQYIKVFKLNQVWRWGPGWSERKPWIDGKPDKSDFFTGPNDPTLTALDRMMYDSRDPRLMDPAEFDQSDDSVKVHRLMCMAIDRLLQDEPEIPSIWREDGQLMIGWDPLPTDDGRLPRQEHDCPMLGATRWFGTWKHNIHEWRWRAARTDLRYDGVHPD
jgi:hypothetical protein